MTYVKVSLFCVSVAIAFFLGRWTIGSEQGSTRHEVAALARPQPSQGTTGLVGDSPQTVDAPKLAAPSASANVGSKTNVQNGNSCLARVSRHELIARSRELEADLELFQETDPRFAARSKMAASDWDRVINLRNVSGIIRFKIATAEDAKVQLRFKEQNTDVEIRYRRTTANGVEDIAVSRSASPLRNGWGIGASRDGASYHVVFPNPVDEPTWFEYSLFAFSVPFDWNGRSEVSAEIFGLSDSLKWENVGEVTLGHAR